jgi:DNA-nicking Smr family endonuclease
MKKKETPKQKEKPFAASPFKSLKGLALGKEEEPAKAPGKEPAKAAKPQAPARPAAPAKEADDALLFLEAMADVKRVNGKGPAPAKGAAAAPAPRSAKDEEEERVFLQAIESLKMDVRFSDELPEEPVRPAPVNRLRQLRRGAIRIDLQLDLHGLTRDEAIENLERFVKGAYGRGQKGVLVITGKGNNSTGEPVLKQAVLAWLRESGKDMVAEIVSAPRDMGGAAPSSSS